MADLKYMFIFCIEGTDPKVAQADIPVPGALVRIRGVGTHEEGAEVAREAREAGTADFIELCGDWGEEGSRLVIEAVDHALPVGYVTYSPEERPKFDAMFESWLASQ